jgi:hypothetical protein
MAIKNLADLDTIGEWIGTLGDGPHGTGPIKKQNLVDIMDTLIAHANRAQTQGPFGLVFVDPTTPSDIAIYRANISAGYFGAKGTWLNFAAAPDTVLIGAGAWGNSYKLDGTAAVVLSADGKTYDVAFVGALVLGVPTLFAVFGAEADDTFELPPDNDDVHDALDAVANIDATTMIVLGRAKIQRVAVATITDTFTDPAAVSTAGSALLSERMSAGVYRSGI